MMIFMTQGCLIGAVGTLLGILGGVLLSAHVTQIIAWIEDLLNQHFVDASVYWIDYLPSLLKWGDVRLVAMLTFVISLLATIYPASRAAKIHPAEALRYE